MDESRLQDEQHSPLFKVKRKGLVLTFFLFYILCGLEYSITIPPAIMDGNFTSSFVYVEAGLYPLAALLPCAVLGHVYDRTKNVRDIFLGSGYVQIVGNFIYAMEGSQFFSLLGRFASGLGDGFIASTVAEVIYLYDATDRIAVFCFLEAGRLIGVLNGPVANYFITKWSRQHKWTVSDKTLPAYIMGCAWALVTMVAFLVLQNVTQGLIKNYNLNDSPFMRRKAIYETVHGNESNESGSDSGDFLVDPVSEKGNGKGRQIDKPQNDLQEVPLNDELPKPFKPPSRRIKGRDYVSNIKKSVSTKYQNTRALINSKYENMRERIEKRMHERAKTAHEHITEYSSDLAREPYLFHILNKEMGLLMVIQWVLWYTQVTFLMFCSHILLEEYMWSPNQVGFAYIAGVGIIFGVLIAMYFKRQLIGKHSIHLILLALAMTQTSLALLIYENPIPSHPGSIFTRTLVFLITAVLVFASVPATLVSFKILLSSMVRPGIQGTLQGLSTTVVRLTLLTAVLLSSTTVHHRQAYASTMTVICFIVLVLLFLGNNLIKRRIDENTTNISY